MSRLQSRTSNPENSIWLDIHEDTFRQHLVELEKRTNAVPVDPQMFPLEEDDTTTERILPLRVEQQLADDLAFLAAIEEGAQSVAAVCLEEHMQPTHLTVRFAALDLALGGEVKAALQHIVDALTTSSLETDYPNLIEDLFEQIVKLHFRRLLARLRSNKWEKPKYLSKQHKKPLWQDFRNLIHPKNVAYIPGIDIASPDAGSKVIDFLNTKGVSSLATVVITAGYFATESLEKPSFEAQERMYRTCAIGPTILVTTLANETKELLGKDSKVIFVSSESGSITLRHEQEGGGNYGHHASKTALNMSAKLLSLDLKDRGVAIAVVHPGFMRTEMTKGVGFDKFWDEGGAVTPDVAAKSLAEWIETFDLSKTGEYWAPRGPGDIGTAEPVLGPTDKLPTPLQLPW
ncbi:hypothetical protein N0V86_006918 [Didymella sp. IMI 355093]|nr:hypothetical protein N0V86_006918 [Didymella sp. IMI 355093]